MKVLKSHQRTPVLEIIAASLFAIILLCSFTSFPGKQASDKSGKEVFESNCEKCHGADGTKGKWGAKNLRVSKLSDSDMRTIITNGKRIMPAWGKRLSGDEILLVIEYVKNLRK